MSDAPDQIWIDSNGGNWSPCSGGTQDVEYRRADLPPTLSAAMQLPEVKALVHAVASQLAYMDMCGDHGDLYNRMTAALAAIKEPKT